MSSVQYITILLFSQPEDVDFQSAQTRMGSICSITGRMEFAKGLETLKKYCTYVIVVVDERIDENRTWNLEDFLQIWRIECIWKRRSGAIADRYGHVGA
jgi:hypothetical protein